MRFFVGAMVLGLGLGMGLGGPVMAQGAAPLPVAASTDVQERFVRAVEEARQAYTGGVNDLARGAARPRRAEALCRIVPRGRVENWVGKVVTLASSAGGRGVIAIEMAPRVVIATNRADAGDEADRTLLDPRTILFANASTLAPGDRVQFSGQLLPGTADCFKEVGRDAATSLTQPEFVIRLDALRKVVPPPSNAVLSGQVPPMSIAQSSEYVRDAVEVIAGASACGVENRRVFGVIIKVLIRATAGQSSEQRDLLIDLMFNPASERAQAKEACDMKTVALDRLESEVN